MDVEKYGNIPNYFSKSFKIKWTPRFIRLEELLIAFFLYGHNHQKKVDKELISMEELLNVYFRINQIKKQDKFKIDITVDKINDYALQTIKIPGNKLKKKNVVIAVGNIKMENDECTNVLTNRWAGLSRNKKQALRNLLAETYNDSNKKVDLLVFPELYLPIYWLNEVVDFSKKSQTAIVTGLQYIPYAKDQVKNYIAAILPFTFGGLHYKNAFIFIREKNDYSPKEKINLAKHGKYCFDRPVPNYQIYLWKGLDLATFVCFEFTDIFARALLKSKCDIIAAPVFNSDTTYFSNIIDSAVRDLHTIIVQANNSKYGDSRITGPYNRDNKDIIKIKGCENDHILIGEVDLSEILKFQAEYYRKLGKDLKQMGKKKGLEETRKSGSELKKLSARYDNSRASIKLKKLLDSKLIF